MYYKYNFPFWTPNWHTIILSHHPYSNQLHDTFRCTKVTCLGFPEGFIKHVRRLQWRAALTTQQWHISGPGSHPQILDNSRSWYTLSFAPTPFYPTDPFLLLLLYVHHATSRGCIWGLEPILLFPSPLSLSP